MKRSGEFWLNCLSDDIREKWLKNYNPKDFVALEDYLEREMPFGNFINSFRWRFTLEGYDYWWKLYNTDEIKLIRNYKLKQLGL